MNKKDKMLMFKRNLKIVLVNLILLTIFGFYYVERQKQLDVLTTENAKREHFFNLYKRREVLIKSLRRNVLNGDTIAYNRLRTIYMNTPHEGEFLFYSIIVANKCHYPLAYYDVYLEIRFLEKLMPDMSCNKETKTLMYEYLKVAARLGNSKAKYDLRQLHI
jgi:hypothetical protein